MELEEETLVEQPDPEKVRKLPWFIDVFLYPVSVPGLMLFAIFIVVPLLIDALLGMLGIFAFVSVIFVLFLGIKIIIYLYVYWRICECVRDSACGGLRVPGDLFDVPTSLGEMLSQVLKIAICFVIFWGPFIGCACYVYSVLEALFWCIPYFLAWPTLGKAMITRYIFLQPHGSLFMEHPVLFLLLSYGVFFLPMGVLAVIMFDSLRALNPILLIKSIFSVFLQYCGIVLILCVFGALPVIIKREVFLRSTTGAQWEVYLCISKIIKIYLLLVTAHLLGRFYYRNEKRLYWEV
jgi:hypothetical protein